MPWVGGYYHDYISVLDVCSALEILSNNAIAHKGEIFNIGTGKQYTNDEVKEIVERITGKQINIDTSVKLNPQNVSQMWQTDSSKMQAFGWEAKIGLIKNLEDMVKSYE